MNMDGNADNGAPLYATTDGIVSTQVGWSESAGWNIQWKDNSGKHHWYMHMLDQPKNSSGTPWRTGDTVRGGDFLGAIGNTGASSSAHLHYQIQDNAGGSSTGGTKYNPLTYFNWVGGSRVEPSASLSAASGWNGYKNRSELPLFMTTAQNAGLTPAQTASILSLGIWEDSAKKLFGQKSLTDVTYDSNGQQAVGIMNWVDRSIDYGDTVGEQLEYIKNAYLTDDPTHYRGYVCNDGYNNNYAWGIPFENVTGRKPSLKTGDLYSDLMEHDIVEGSAQFYGNALVPGCLTTDAGLAKYVGTAVDAYNWMFDNGYVGGVNSTIGSGDIPPLDMSKLYNGGDGSNITNVINRYNISRTSDEKQLEMLHTLMNHKFSVSDERVAALLEEILKKIEEREPRGGKPQQGGTPGTSKLFDDDRIPSQVTKMSVG